MCRLQNCGNQKPLGDTEPDFEVELGESDEEIAVWWLTECDDSDDITEVVIYGLELPLKDQASVEAFDGFLRDDAELRKSVVHIFCAELLSYLCDLLLLLDNI